ncbi:MAG: DNA repair protein RadA [Elusimicrobia bacterium]|nr:DNA repair protein RadA [Elusimicrobiota bacterium]
MKWLGQCPGCEEWNTLAEEVVESISKAVPKTRSLTQFSSEVVLLERLSSQKEIRTPVGLSEMDRLMGGGLVPGQVVLLAGPPGIGKSTLMLQIADKMSGARDSGLGASKKPVSSLQPPGSVLYVSGEESLSQVSSRAKRLGVSRGALYLLCETDLSKIIDAIHKVQPSMVILDSIQTVYHPELTGSPGSVGQVRECAAELLRICKSRETILFLLGHVTKEGALAGPKVLEHIVDTVLYFETERQHLLRVLRAHKNRFGPTSEIGIFEMGEKGLQEIADVSQFFVAREGQAAKSGRSLSVSVEGTRPLLTEIQALVTPTRYALPRRMVTGFDLNRTQLLLASMEKHLKVHWDNRDVFVNLAGGMRLKDPALDLGICAALVSSFREVPVPADTIYLGEVGLLGDVGRIPFLNIRLKEAARVGFKKAVVPAHSSKETVGVGIEVLPVENLMDAFSHLMKKLKGEEG